MYRRLVIDNQYFTEVNAFISGDIDNGLFIISGKLLDNISFEKAEEMIMEEISQIINGNIADDELIKVKNKADSHLSFVKSSVLSKAMTLSYYEMLGDAELSNKEIIMYDSVSKADIALTAQEMFDRNNLNILTYSKSGK